VLDDGKTLSLSSGIQGGKLKRWKVGCTNKTVAKQQEAIIKTKLLAGAMVSEQVGCPLSQLMGAPAQVQQAGGAHALAGCYYRLPVHC